MSIEEVTENIAKTVGNKKGLLIAGCGVFGVLFLLSLKNSGGGETVNVTSYSSYPDVDRNADVIISSIQNSIDFQTEQLNDSLDMQTGILGDNLNTHTSTLLVSDNMTQGLLSEGFQSQKEYMAGQFQQQHDLISDGFERQHDLVSDGFERQQHLLENMHTETMQGLDLINTNMGHYANDITYTIQHESDSLRGTLMTGFDGVMQSMDEQYSSLNDSINSVSSQVNKVYEDVRIYEKVETPSVSVGNNSSTSRPLTNPEINALTDFLKGDTEKNYSTNPVSKVDITPTTSTNLVGIGKKVGVK